MKIGIDAHYVGVRHGGNEYYFENVIKALASLEPGPERYYAFNYKGAGRGILPGEPLTLVPLRKGSVYMQRAWEIPLLARKLELDVLHVPFNFLPVGKSRKLVTIHDLAFLHVGDTFDRFERKRMALLTGFSAKRADHVFTISEYSKRDIMRQYGIPDRKITVTYCAVDRGTFSVWSPEERKAFLASKGIGYRFLLFVGTLQPRKNVVNMLRAFSRLSGDARDTHLILVGRKGWIFEDIFRLIREENLEARVHHMEHVDQRDLTGLYNTAEALIFPSLFEGFGMPILEAMSCGCPVASSDATSMPEVCGNAALTFDPMDIAAMSDSMARILADGSLRASLSAKGLANCDRFSWKSAAEEVRRIYRTL